MAYVYRCSSCRTRNTFNRNVRSYTIKRWCRHCGHRRFYVDKERIRRKPCYCGGYHHPHRLFSRLCEHSPESIHRKALNEGTCEHEVVEIALDVAWSRPLRVSRSCPF